MTDQDYFGCGFASAPNRPRGQAVRRSLGLAGLATSLLLAIGLVGVPASAQDRFDLDRPAPAPETACTLPPTLTPQEEHALFGNGGPDPLYYDAATGVWLDPVSGMVDAQGHRGDWGDVVDEATGARFSLSRGLWLDPETREPVRDRRLNDFPYYDPETNEAVDPETGARSPYAVDLMTIGAQRQAEWQIRWACLGGSLKQRIDPKTRAYLPRPDGTVPDDTAFGTYNATRVARPRPTYEGDRYAPSAQFLPFHHYANEDDARERFELVNGMSRAESVAKLYKVLAPESAEGGGSFALLEQRGSDDSLLVMVTARGLLDDSVSAEQVVLFFDTSMPGRDRLMSVGTRRKCGRPGSHAAWTTERCP